MCHNITLDGSAAVTAKIKRFCSVLGVLGYFMNNLTVQWTSKTITHVSKIPADLFSVIQGLCTSFCPSVLKHLEINFLSSFLNVSK